MTLKTVIQLSLQKLLSLVQTLRNPDLLHCFTAKFRFHLTPSFAALISP